MDVQALVVANYRVSPVSVVSHGHSVTSGHTDTIDYYVSYDPLELSNGADHYSEQLVRLASFHSPFATARATPTGLELQQAPGDHVDNRRRIFKALVEKHAGGSVAESTERHVANWTVALERCAGMRLYLCPQSLYKLHPSFDDVFARLLDADRCGILLMIRPGVRIQNTSRLVSTIGWLLFVPADCSNTCAWSCALSSCGRQVNRFVAAVNSHFGAAQRPVAEAAMSRWLFLDSMPHADFLELLACSDVLVDTYPFGACALATVKRTHGKP